MKRKGNLYSKICSIKNLRKAHKNASKGKGYYTEVQEINKDPDKYLIQIRKMLLHHTYHTSQYDVFTKTEGRKTRIIYKLPYYPDRIVQWAIMQVIEPYLIKAMISDTYSAIPGRGIHKGLLKLQKCMRNYPEECKYCLKIDVRHFYQNINHEILKQKYRDKFKDPELLWILDEIIDSINTIDVEDIQELKAIGHDYIPETGVPIGNYISQYSGNFYLSDFDHWIKEKKHIKYYFRYMDDMVFLGNNKEDLHKLFKEVQEYLWNNLKLRVKPNYQIFPSDVRGIDFLGYRIFKDYTLIRKTTCKNMKRKMKKIGNNIQNDKTMTYTEYCSANSYKGWLKCANHYRIYQKYFKPLEPFLLDYYETQIKFER